MDYDFGGINEFDILNQVNKPKPKQSPAMNNDDPFI